MTKIFYWSPFLSKIATVSAVIKSVRSLKRYSKKNLKISIIDAVGEWDSVKEQISEIETIKLYNNSFYEKLFKEGFFNSRFSKSIIFIFSFFKLLKVIKKKKPDFLIAHLIVSLPLTLNFFFLKETKLIIRISGLPRLNFFRKIYWKIFSKNVYRVTCPTFSTLTKLRDMKIFDEDKLELLYDPIISVNDIIKKKKEDIDKKFSQKKYILSIGRLTKQKNFTLLIEFFKEINVKYPEYLLVILGEGEERLLLEKLIKSYDLNNKIFLMGHKKNVYKYLSNCECFILSSRWEDPGFVLVEASFLNVPKISSNCKNGPSEILENGKGGFLFENENKKDLINKFEEFKISSKKRIYSQLINSKIKSKHYTEFYHFLKLKKILSI